jgi:RHS repeat-associated protein
MPLFVRNFAPFRPILFLAMLFGFLSSARAQSITVDCSDPSGSATVSWSGMNDTFQVNGSGAPPSGNLIIPAGATVSLTGQYESSTQLLASPVTLDILDPVTNHIRGQLTASGSDAGGSGFENFVVTFIDDFPELTTAPPPGDATIVATGSAQDVTMTFHLPSPITFSIVGPGLSAPTSSLGVTGTSTNPSGATTQPVNTTTTAAVNTASGNDYVTFSDLIVPGKGLRFSFIRAYNDQDTYSGPLGLGWTHSYNILLTQDSTSGRVTIKEGDGHQKTFSPNGIGGYVAPPGVYDVLASTGANTWTLTRPNQTVLAFGPDPLNPALIVLLSITDKNANSQTLAYDANGNLLTFTDIGGGTYTFNYDANNHLTSMTDVSLSHTFHYSVPAAAGLASYTDDLGKQSTYTYSGGLLSIASDAAGNPAIGNTFDSSGRVTQTRRTIGATICVTSYSYDDTNHITTITDPLGGVTKHYYDASKRLIKTVNALGYSTAFTYDTGNNVLTVTNPLNQTTTYTYDARGNRTSVTDPLNHSTLFTYDTRNNLTLQTDANGKASTFSYDVHSNLTQVADALGGITKYSYDARGNKLTFQNAKGNTTSDTYSLSNRVLTTTDPALKQTSFSYDAGGNITSVGEPAGNSKALAYDNLGHLTNINYTGVSPFASTAAVAYLYDPDGNRTRMTDGTGMTSYVYDTLNRVTNITSPEGAVSYAYDCNDNRTSIVFAGKTVNFGYDAISRLISVNDGGKSTTYSYDAADNVTQITYPTGASVGYSYDAAGRITRVSNTYTGSSGNPVSSFSYLMDNVGNRTQVTDGSGKSSAYVYDDLNRLLSGTVALKVTSYKYDAVGNRIAQLAPNVNIAYTYDAADKLQTAGSTVYTYDANGNQISRTASGSTTTFQYDAADRLVQVSGGGGPTSTFAYDGDGNRVSQKVGSSAYKYLNDIATGFATVLDETGPDGHIQYVRGRSLISADASNFTYYYHYDAQNTVAGVTDTTGHLAERYVYDVFGQLQLSVPEPGIKTQNKFGYTGEALDPGTSLYFLRARYYDPSLGRFMTRDSFNGFDRSPQTLNKFTYVRNNPATLTDRTGLCDDDPDFEFYWPCAPPLP